MRGSRTGFALLTAALTVLLVSSLSLAFLLRILTRWDLARDLEAQLYALVLAGNGIEFARTLLPLVEIDVLLSGPDGEHCGTAAPEWRNPMTLVEALEIVPRDWVPHCDDGVPAFHGESLLPHGYRAEGGGYFFLRISNNAEEPPAEDHDHEVLVRALGIVPRGSPSPFFPQARNSIALVEARLRQERPFRLPGPLTLYGESGDFRWQGEGFLIDGGDALAIPLISLTGDRLRQDLLGSWSPPQTARVVGRGGSPSLGEATPLFQSDSLLAPQLEASFWAHFLDRLPDFVDDARQEIAFLPDGGRLDTPFTGLLVARKDLRIGSGGRIDGLLLHLGEGTLVLEDGARLEGGAWMSNPDLSGSTPGGGHLRLEVSGSARISYRPSLIGEALALLPPSQLGWRILFSETVR